MRSTGPSVIRRRVAGRSAPVLILAGFLLAGAAGIGLMSALDGTEVTTGIAHALADPLGFALIAVALAVAFSIRAAAWCRLVPGLGWPQSLAAIHLALGANHVLPFRLGEPLRVVSVARRAGIGVGEATSTTVVLRAADILSLILLGAIALPRFAAGHLRVPGAVVIGVIALIAAVALAHIARLRARPDVGASSVRLPDLVTLGLVFAAWIAESVVVWRVAGWFDVTLDLREAVAVLAAAVSVQIVAVTPGGFGTYEAAGAAALVAIGIAPSTALAIALAVHAVKTLYSLAVGLVAVVRPEPSILGRLRLLTPARAVPPTEPGLGPIVLFLPAHNEEPRIADVIDRAPTRIGHRPVEVVVIDDGSTDRTAEAAMAAGATVISHDTNRGLGAAVRTGLDHCRLLGAAAGAFCDADGEYDPGQLPDLVEPILAGRSHYVVGSRFGGRIRRMYPHRRLGNHLLTRWVRFMTGAPVTDGQSGFRALSSSAIAFAEIRHDYNYAQVLTMDLIEKGFGYDEVGIDYSFRRSGRSFVRPLTYLRHVVPAVWHQLNPPPVSTASQEEPPCKIVAGSVASAPLS